MQAGKAYLELLTKWPAQYTGTCAPENGVNVPGLKWKTLSKVIENDRAQILLDFQIQTYKTVANQPDIVVAGKPQKKEVKLQKKEVVDVAIPNEKLEKYQGLKEGLETMCGVKLLMVPLMIGAMGAMTPKLGEWLQEVYVCV